MGLLPDRPGRRTADAGVLAMNGDPVSFLLYSSDAALAQRLAAALAPLGRLTVESQPPGTRAASVDPSLVLVDFSQADTNARLEQACGQTQAVLQRYPGSPCLADRKSTRLNSSHVKISYAVFCLKKKT